MRWPLITLAVVVCAASVAIALWVLDPQFGHWLQVHTGTVNEPGPYYGFWSGFGSDLEEFGILGAAAAGIYQLVKKYNCHEPGCWRVGQYPAAGGQFLLCHRHHPDYRGRKPTHELIQRLHREHLERQAAMHGKLQDIHRRTPLADNSLVGSYTSIGGRCWPEAAVVASPGIGRHRGLKNGLVRLPAAEGMPFMFKSLKSTSTSMILLGILAVIVGIIAIAWPQATILALVILFAVYAFMDAGLQAARAFSSRSAGPVFGHLLLALISLAAGVVALVWPGPTAYVLVIVVAAWALVGGLVEIFAGFQSGETAGTRALFIVSGLISVAFGVVLFARPNVGAVTIALLFGLYFMIYGFSQIAAGVQVRQVGNAIRPLTPAHKAA